MIIGVLEGGQTIENSTNSNEGDYDGYKKEPVTIDGATGVRAVGKLKAESEVGPPAGTYMINYALKKGDKVYLALYYQYPSGPVSQNLQGDFELMVKSLKFK
jgi:hypothetical protein